MDQLENNYQNRLVVDLDDTLSFAKNRDFENAEPNLELINKINFLHGQGWEILILTARGQLSCEGNISKIKDKYEKQVKSWLKKNNVEYHKLSFEKPLATYYIDDKSLTPEKFLNIEIKEMGGGWSGEKVFKFGDKVHKTQPNCHDVAYWYEQSRFFLNVPKVYSVVGNTICIEFIDNCGAFNLQRILNVLDHMKKFPPIKKGGGFKSFFKKMKSHVEKTPIFHEIIPLLKNKYSYFNSGTIETFCHGDFSIENILFDKNGKVYLIDPIVEGWNHWLLDLSKLVFSLRFNRMELAAEHVYATYNYVGGLSYIITLLEACQWVRVYKYAPENKKKIIIDGYIEVMKRLECLR